MRDAEKNGFSAVLQSSLERDTYCSTVRTRSLDSRCLACAKCLHHGKCDTIRRSCVVAHDNTVLDFVLMPHIRVWEAARRLLSKELEKESNIAQRLQDLQVNTCIRLCVYVCIYVCNCI